MNRAISGALLLFVVVVAPAGAAIASESAETQESSIDYASMTDEELIAIASDPKRGWLENSCDVGEPAMGELHQRFSDDNGFARLYYLSSAFCADQEKRFSDGFAALTSLENYVQNSFTDRLGFYFARRTENPAALIERFAALSDERLEGLESDVAWDALRKIREPQDVDKFGDIALGWVDDGKFAYLDVVLHEGFAIRALDAAVRQGRSEKIGELLTYIQSPSSYISLLAEREYEAHWPEIEQRAGPNLKIVSKEYANWAQSRFSNEPTDRDRFSEAARALQYAGEYEKVIELAQNWRKREGRGLEIEEGDGWALNLEAYAYDALGQRAKADEVFDYLAALDPEEHPWVVNFVINRALRLVGHRKWQEGLDAADMARGVAEDYGSTYGKMLIAWSRSCALNKLDRGGEASEDIKYLLDNQAESPKITAQAMLCLDRRDEGAKIMQEALDDETLRPLILDSFQSDVFDLFYTPSELPQVNELIEDYPELRDSVLQYVRILPERFVPIANLKRKK